MSYELMTDDEIIHDLAAKFDLLRRSKKIKDSDLVLKGGTNRVVLNKFRNAQGGISLKTFIRLMRGLGELGRLEALLENQEFYSPSGKDSDVPPKRVRDRKSDEGGFSWGDDE